MHDPIADMLTRIRNAQAAQHKQVSLMSSNIKENIVRVLQQEGFVNGYHIEALPNGAKLITIDLKYFKGAPVISKITRISKPGLRVYKTVGKLKPIPGFGISILTTSKGVMSHADAKRSNIGGEVICEVA